MAPVGLKDVARAAGVSYKTVSRVVNGEATVSGPTRARVEAAVAELGYRPNHSARSLRRGRTQTLRLILDVAMPPQRYERFQDDVISGVIDRATADGYAVLLELASRGDNQSQLGRLGDRRSDGTVLLDGRTGSPIVPVLHGSGTPTAILVNPDADPTFGSIDVDFEGGGFEMVNHLLGLGHRTIAHLADNPVLHSSRERRKGYERALREAGIGVDEELIVMTGSRRDHGYAATERLLKARPDVTGFFCVNDLTAFGAIECLREHGRRVPGDASVTGYDDIPIARFAKPPLTTVRIPWYEIAEAATAGLIEAVERGGEFPFRQTFPVELCLRETTGPLTGS